MDSPTIAPPLAGKIMGSVADAFVIAEWQDPGGPVGERRLIAPWHLHNRDDEAWYVIEGTLRVQVGEDDVEVHAGAGVFVRRGTPHTYWNPGPERVGYLLVMSSNIFALIQDIHALKDRTPSALREVFKKHDSELVER